MPLHRPLLRPLPGTLLQPGDHYFLQHPHTLPCEFRPAGTPVPPAAFQSPGLVVLEGLAPETGTHRVCYFSSAGRQAYSALGFLTVEAAQPPRPQNVSACAPGAPCPTDGQTPFVVEGQHLSPAAGVQVFVGPYQCAVVEAAPGGGLRCTGYPGTGADHTVRVYTAAGLYGALDQRVAYAPRPAIAAVSGCTDYPPLTAHCPRAGTAALTITGTDIAGADAVSVGGAACATVTAAGAGALVCAGYGPAPPANDSVRVANRYGESDAAPHLRFAQVPFIHQSVSS